MVLLYEGNLRECVGRMEYIYINIYTYHTSTVYDRGIIYVTNFSKTPRSYTPPTQQNVFQKDGELYKRDETIKWACQS